MRLNICVQRYEQKQELEKIRGLKVPEMEQALNAYYTITALERFRELERLRSKARHDEAQALHHARQEGEVTKALSMAQLMIADGEPIDKIMRYTGLTQKEVEALT